LLDSRSETKDAGRNVADLGVRDQPSRTLTRI